MGTGSFQGVKRPGRGVEHPPPSSAEVEGRVELYNYSPSGSSWPVIGTALPLRSQNQLCTVLTKIYYVYMSSGICLLPGFRGKKSLRIDPEGSIWLLPVKWWGGTVCIESTVRLLMTSVSSLFIPRIKRGGGTQMHCLGKTRWTCNINHPHPNNSFITSTFNIKKYTQFFHCRLHMCVLYVFENK